MAKKSQVAILARNMILIKDFPLNAAAFLSLKTPLYLFLAFRGLILLK